MTDYLLDTTEIIDYGRGHSPTVALLNGLYEQGNSLEGDSQDSWPIY